jgi:hypothetical protein
LPNDLDLTNASVKKSGSCECTTAFATHSTALRLTSEFTVAPYTCTTGLLELNKPF